MDFCRSLSDQGLKGEVDFTEESSRKKDICNICCVDKVNVLLHGYLSFVLVSWTTLRLQHSSGSV